MTDLLESALAAQLGRPLYDAINKHLADGQQAEDRLHVAEATARHWHQAALDRGDIPAAHSVACIRAALGGETDPGHLGWPEPAPDTAATQATEADARYAQAVARVESSGPAPAEHCGHQSPETLLTRPRTECVLRPGHHGSHADDHGCRWRPVADDSSQAEDPDAEFKETAATLNTAPAGLDSPSRRAGLRDEIAAAIWERQNPGHRWADCEYRWRADAEADADHVLVVLYREWPWLRAEAEEATPAGPDWLREQYATVIRRWWDNDDDGANEIAAAVLRVRDRHLEQLRQRLELATATLEDRPHPGPTDRHLAIDAWGSAFDRANTAEQQRDQLAADLRYVLDYTGPSHAHEQPGVWDTSGKPCDHCARLDQARQHLAELDQPKEPADA